MRLLDQPLTREEKRGMLEMLYGNISRICISDDAVEIVQHLGFVVDRLNMIAYSRLMELKARSHE